MEYPSKMRRQLLSLLKPFYPTLNTEDLLIAACEELLNQNRLAKVEQLPAGGSLMNIIEIRDARRVYAACNAKCYNPDAEPCDCPCGGMNCGVGLEQALLNIPAILQCQIPQAWIKAHEGDIPGHPMIFCQLTLWILADNSASLIRAASALQTLRQRLNGK